MQNRTIGVIIAAIIAVAAISAAPLAHFSPEASDGSSPTTSTVSPSVSPYGSLSPAPTPTALTPTPSPTATQTVTASQQLEAYTGYLVSFSYVASQTSGVESTQLVFTNKTFNYAGYIQLGNGQTYNVTYDSDNPNQALNVTRIDLTIGLMGNTEQASITNVVFNSNTQLTATVQNTGTDAVTITSATIDGNTAVITNSPVTIAKGDSALITINSATGFTNTASYQIQLTTAKGNPLCYTATYNGP